MAFDPREQLLAGAVILEPAMGPAGFKFQLDATGRGSGGDFATGSFVRGDRRLELHYRWGLGIVVYHVGEWTLDHRSYMKLLDVDLESEFRSSSLDKTLDGFERLKKDLQRFGADFLNGDASQFRKLAEQLKDNPQIFSGFGALNKRVKKA
ncbi:MAG: hypothetical protein PHU85_19690 [Phycisphaerae bacterium]|nr:hypothetical protein [Phycisphaerae bacterium]